MELEDREPARARDAYEKLLAADGNADDAYRGLERVLAGESNWYELVAVQRRHIAAAKTPAVRVELYLESAKIYERELDDPHKAIDSLMNVLAIEDANKTALSVLPRLYVRTEQFDRAVDTLQRHAPLETGDVQKAALYAEAGRMLGLRGAPTIAGGIGIPVNLFDAMRIVLRKAT